MPISRSIILTVFVLGVFAAASFAWAAAPPKPEFKADEAATLEKAEPILREEQFNDADGNRAGRAVGYILINSNADAFWRVIQDFNHYPDFYPNLSAAKITRKDGNHTFVFFTLDVIGLIKVKYNIDHTFIPEDNRLTYKMDKTQKNDYEEASGFWQVWPWDEKRILVCYSVYIKTGRWIPGFAQTFVEKIGLTKWGLRKVVTCIKKRVELGESYKGEGDRKANEAEIPKEAVSPPPASPSPGSSPKPGP